jgi:hypothetical protein
MTESESKNKDDWLDEQGDDDDTVNDFKKC